MSEKSLKIISPNDFSKFSFLSYPFQPSFREEQILISDIEYQIKWAHWLIEAPKKHTSSVSSENIRHHKFWYMI